MKRSRKRIMSILLAFSIVFGSVGYAFAQKYSVAETNDPFACMVSLIEEVDASQLLAEESYML